MKILALNGSPRGRRSNTDRLLAPMLGAAREAGAETEEIYVHELEVSPCTGCFACWGRTPGRCVQDDDDATLVRRKILACDVLIWAFPLYCYGVPAAIQAVQERLIPLVLPEQERRGKTMGHPARYPGQGPRWLVLSNCGFPEQAHFEAVRAKFRQLARAGGIRQEQFIGIGAGEMLRPMEAMPEAAEALRDLRADLCRAGRELAGQGCWSEETLAALNRPLTERMGMTAQDYAERANEQWARLRRRANRE
jgi:multimeric flavodoxin WrbA